MFSWPWSTKRPPEPKSIDRVWANLAARDAALVRAAKAGPVAIIAFFDDTVARVQSALKSAGCAESSSLKVMRVDRLEDARSLRSIYLAERHPLPASNRALLERLEREAPGVVPVCFSALDEPFMRHFGGERVVALMKQLGVLDEEAIEHPMVSKALANAREKIEKKVGAKASVPVAASSMQEWLDRHLPQ